MGVLPRTWDQRLITNMFQRRRAPHLWCPPGVDMFHSLLRKTTRSWVIATIPGWWYTYPSENMTSSVGMMTSWDDEIPN